LNVALHDTVRSRKRRIQAGSLMLHVLLIAMAVTTLTPFVWLVCSTFKTKADFFSYTFLPWDHLGGLTLDNYRRLFAQEPFAVWMVNSIFLASAYTVTVVTLSSLGGFALAKYRFAGRKWLMLIMLVTMLVPGQVLLLPNYDVMRRWGWMNTYAAILVPGAVSVFGMFLFRQAMMLVPDELLQAGRMDGCSEARLWWEVALPIVRPMIGAYTLLSFMAAWNSFLWPQVILQTPEKLTLPIGLSNMINLPEYQTNLGILMAGTLLSILPVALLFFVLQRDFIAGLASGAVKG
jgi:ABC-type glycerol-3-phosphate transport system permease component